MCFDYETCEFVDTRSVKTRKPHKCEGCWRTIPPGETATKSSGKFDGSFFCTYTCESCERKIYSVAADEIEHGCRWHEAWIAVGELSEYLSERKACENPVKILDMPTLDDCMKHVNELWERRKSAVTQ